MGRRTGVEYPVLDKEGHTNDCRVWDGYFWMDACLCGAVDIPEARVLPGLSQYEIRKDNVIRSLRTGRLLVPHEERNAVTLKTDDDKLKRYSVWDLVRWAFPEGQ